MNEDQFAGTVRQVGGQFEEAAGNVMNDRGLKAEGFVDQAAGAAQNLYSNAKEKARETLERVAPVTREGFDRAVAVTRENSLLAMLAAGAVGFALAVAFRPTNPGANDRWTA